MRAKSYVSATFAKLGRKRDAPKRSALLELVNQTVKRVGDGGSAAKYIIKAQILDTEVKLNFGGSSFRIRPKTVVGRSGGSRLHRFVLSSHADRLLMCDSFIQTSGEYFFERSPQTFEPIYQYFVTGKLHKPQRMCALDFRCELYYWQLPMSAVAHCCRKVLEEELRFLSHVDDELNEGEPSLFSDSSGHLAAGWSSTDSEMVTVNSSQSWQDQQSPFVPRSKRATSSRRNEPSQNTGLSFFKKTVPIIRSTKQERSTQWHQQFENICLGNIRRRIWKSLEYPESGVLAQMAAILSVSMIVLSVFTLILESTLVPTESGLPQLGSWNIVVDHRLFVMTEMCCSVRGFRFVYFTIEMLMRLFAAPRRLQQMRSADNLLDVMAIVPFYVQLLADSLTNQDVQWLKQWRISATVLRVLRVTRVLRIFKFGRYSRSLQTFGTAIANSAHQLLALAILVGFMVVLFSSVIFFCESDTPGTNFTSIPASFWFGYTTLTRVGFGDVYPLTPCKLVAIACVFMGVLVTALPIPIMVDKWLGLTNQRRAVKRAKLIRKRFHPRLKSIKREHNQTRI